MGCLMCPAPSPLAYQILPLFLVTQSQRPAAGGGRTRETMHRITSPKSWKSIESFQRFSLMRARNSCCIYKSPARPSRTPFKCVCSRALFFY